MNREAGDALEPIQQCVADERFTVLSHFRDQITRRGLVWPDVLAVIKSPDGAKARRGDPYGRDKWGIVSTASDGLAIELVCVIDTDDAGRLTVFITMY